MYNIIVINAAHGFGRSDIYSYYVFFFFLFFLQRNFLFVYIPTNENTQNILTVKKNNNNIQNNKK